MELLKCTTFVFWACTILFLESCSSTLANNEEKRINVQTALRSVREKINKAEQMRSNDLKNSHPSTLVAVSTKQPVELILEACQAGQTHFGESYIEELISKATNKRIRENCPEIKWHFIGRMTINQLSKIVSVPNLYMIETVDSRRMATALEKVATQKGVQNPIRVFLQVKTDKAEPSAFVKHVIDKCPHLKFSGLMTPGKNNYDAANGPNPEFSKLMEFKKAVCQKLKLSPAEVQISMGMTKDFEKAIAAGSNNVRVGTAIFGGRKN